MSLHTLPDAHHCPFCGAAGHSFVLEVGPADSADDDRYPQVRLRCGKCEAAGPGADVRKWSTVAQLLDRAVMAWNQRVAPMLTLKPQRLVEWGPGDLLPTDKNETEWVNPGIEVVRRTPVIDPMRPHGQNNEGDPIGGDCVEPKPGEQLDAWTTDPGDGRL